MIGRVNLEVRPTRITGSKFPAVRRANCRILVNREKVVRPPLLTTSPLRHHGIDRAGRRIFDQPTGNCSAFLVLGSVVPIWYGNLLTTDHRGPSPPCSPSPTIHPLVRDSVRGARRGKRPPFPTQPDPRPRRDRHSNVSHGSYLASNARIPSRHDDTSGAAAPPNPGNVGDSLAPSSTRTADHSPACGSPTSATPAHQRWAVSGATAGRSLPSSSSCPVSSPCSRCIVTDSG